MMNNFSEIKLSNHTSGTGIFDKKLSSVLKKLMIHTLFLED